MSPYTIPQELASQLELVENPDTRSFKEIISALNHHVPVTTEKNIWAFWHAGLDAMPGWCQRNVVDWVRICGPSWTVRVLDVVPGSPNHALNFASKDLLPDAFVKGSMNGPYVGPHSMDFLRGALLIQYGGVAMDVGCTLMRSLDRVCWDEIADPKSPIEVAVPIMYAQTIANHFVASSKGNPFIEKWHKLFFLSRSKI
ncbi:capsule polysaccharide biosynthesis [Fusarium albosuccineum]|uniref:Capsule polysaccharide biosynthesis n=1 Tax=Fusarium albosuccineum TaxID=1237068 RepID=A0A8H4L0X8_9HYPO|nr:capsule polysaccharide biosynthesis [Fusarium albosuccineum]